MNNNEEGIMLNVYVGSMDKQYLDTIYPYELEEKINNFKEFYGKIQKVRIIREYDRQGYYNDFIELVFTGGETFTIRVSGYDDYKVTEYFNKLKEKFTKELLEC